jgi:FMN phosphatase YigB (HAD superfamily)
VIRRGKIRAVVFDLYGTLVDAPAIAAYAEYADGTADRLGVGRAKFRAVYEADYERRQTAQANTHEEYLVDPAARLEVPLGHAALGRLIRFRLDCIRG